jgi:hypothetical protein
MIDQPGGGVLPADGMREAAPAADRPIKAATFKH